jgi:ABC-type lipoprotein export system ATPase subunit
LANKPEIILADEPTGNLDSKAGGSVMEVLKNLNKEDKITLIVVTHENFIAKYLKKTIYLKDGEIIKRR